MSPALLVPSVDGLSDRAATCFCRFCGWFAHNLEIDELEARALLDELR